MLRNTSSGFLKTTAELYKKKYYLKYSRVPFCDGSFYNDSLLRTCQVGPSTPDLWRTTVATEASFLYLVSF